MLFIAVTGLVRWSQPANANVEESVLSFNTLKCVYSTYKGLMRTSRRTVCASIRKANRFVLCGPIMLFTVLFVAVCHRLAQTANACILPP
jgi:hypothetical protein